MTGGFLLPLFNIFLSLFLTEVTLSELALMILHKLADADDDQTLTSELVDLVGTENIFLVPTILQHKRELLVDFKVMFIGTYH